MALSMRDRLALGAAAAALLTLAVAGWVLLGPAFAEPVADPVADPAGTELLPSGSPVPLASATASADVVVDVEGGVTTAGIVALPGGSRVADAIAAAGGYGPDADLAAAAGSINLAAPLSDGQQVYVPRLGEAAGAGTGSGAGGSAGGLVNLNTASPEELEALPGIGPVTVQRIVAARVERSFTTLEELVEREVMHNGQLEDIRDLVTL